MADRYTPEEIDSINRAYADAMKITGYASAELARQFADAKTGVRNYHQELENSLKQFRTSLHSASQAAVQGFANIGKMGSGGLTQQAETLSNVITSITAGLGHLLKIPWVRTAAAAVAGIATLTTVSAKQADALWKSYKDVSRYGLVKHAGEIFNTMQKFGYGLDELGEMGNLLSDNAEMLAMFKGSAFEGTKAFADLSSSLTRSDLGRELERLGLAPAEINKIGAGYLKLLQSSGQLQSKTTEQLTAGAVAYLKEQDLMTKVLGMNRETQEATQQKALRAEQFAARKIELTARLEEATSVEEREAIENEIKQMDRFSKVIENKFPKLFDGVMAGMGGFINDPETQKLLALAPKATEMLKTLGQAGGASAEEVYETMVAEIKASGKNYASMGLYGQFSELFGSLGNVLQAQNIKLGSFGDALEEGTKAQKETLKGEDPFTKGMADANLAFRNSRDAVEKFVNFGIIPATKTLIWMAEVNEWMATKALDLADVLGAKGRLIRQGGSGLIDPKGDDPGKEGSIWDSLMRKENTAPKPPAVAPPAAPSAAGPAGQKPPAATPQQPQAGGQRKSEDDHLRPQQGGKPQPQLGGQRKSEDDHLRPQQGGKPQPQLGVTPQTAAPPDGESVPKLVQISGKKGGGSAPANAEYAQQFQQLIDYLEESGYPVKELSSYRPGAKIAGTRKPSMHARGGAVDINPKQNPQGSTLVTDLPEGIADIARGFGLGWGGNWKSSKDAMHFSGAESEGGSLFKAKDGGILSGPRSGYRAVLHGTEAVVPLPDGRSIPVEMPEIASGINQQIALLSEQLSKTDDLIYALNTLNSTSNKILQYSQ